jgi:hypothetical protein
MQYATILTVLAAASGASSLKRQVRGCTTVDDCDSEVAAYLDSMCSATNATGYPDRDVPCNQVEVISLECMWGANGLADWNGENNVDHDPTSNSAMFSNATQRDCVCQSDYFQLITACNNCYMAHGGPAPVAIDVASASSSYCAITNSPTLRLGDWLDSLTSQFSSSSINFNTFSDPIGNNTAVSKYYTPSITGSAAWIVAEATVTPSSGEATASASYSTSLATSGGQIVATAAQATGSLRATKSGVANATTTASHNGVAGRGTVAAAAGIVALAGMVIIL